jgi:hypothetical protein
MSRRRSLNDTAEPQLRHGLRQLRGALTSLSAGLTKHYGDELADWLIRDAMRALCESTQKTVAAIDRAQSTRKRRAA